MLDEIEAVIFDLDGTLIDSMGVWKEIDIEFLQEYNIEVPAGLSQRIAGMSFTDTALYFIEQFDIPLSVDEMKARWNQMAYDAYEQRVPFKDGAYEFLRYLKDNHFKTGIATSNSRILVDAVMDSLGMNGYIDCVRTSCEVPVGKPSPDIYLLVANDLDVSPSRCLVFEDIPEGIMAGNAANMRTCAVKDEHSKEKIREKKRLANYYIDSYYDILTKNYEVLK